MMGVALTLMTLAVVSLCVLFAQNYMPPPRAARIFPNISMAAATVGALIGFNIFVWLAWKWPPGWRFMQKVFMLVPSYPYLSSMVGNLFSHQMLPHLATNMAVLWFVGTKCKRHPHHNIFYPLVLQLLIWMTYSARGYRPRPLLGLVHCQRCHCFACLPSLHRPPQELVDDHTRL